VTPVNYVGGVASVVEGSRNFERVQAKSNVRLKLYSSQVVL
jgi:hypothetical protein